MELMQTYAKMHYKTAKEKKVRMCITVQFIIIFYIYYFKGPSISDV